VADGFDEQFEALNGLMPFLWQRRLLARLLVGDVPPTLDFSTGLGKTSVMAIWLIARVVSTNLPRRLVYVVDRWEAARPLTRMRLRSPHGV
jgi:CRISPR-associated endonuclease/helicase Cas3